MQIPTEQTKASVFSFFLVLPIARRSENAYLTVKPLLQAKNCSSPCLCFTIFFDKPVSSPYIRLSPMEQMETACETIN
jgi:hypothetical protein